MENSLTYDNKLRLSHVLQKGINESKNYGLSLASSTFLPQAIIKRAYDVSANIEDSMKVGVNLANFFSFMKMYREA